MAKCSHAHNSASRNENGTQLFLKAKQSETKLIKESHHGEIEIFLFHFDAIISFQFCFAFIHIDLK